ncbi:MAG: hypothetical protein RBU24_05340 [Kiritimatiellia bacterium]|jgi:hypothetical protein|nr:hypothetical protein [Kiritimatiellia bacterium]
MKTVLLIALLIYLPCASIAGVSKEEAFRIAEQFYKKFADILAPTNVPFADIYKRPFCVSHGGVNIENDIYGERIWVKGQISIGAHVGDSQITAFSNQKLYQYIKTNETQNIPVWSVQQAYVQAQQYLKLLEVQLDKRAILSEVSFADDGWGCTSIWRVVWCVSDGGYQYDDFFKDIYHPCARICFSEKYGLVFFTSTPFPPSPKTTEVHITRETAIFKAEKAVPLVMRTPYYQQCRLPGFKVSGVKSAELRIACPNWLLDPARAIWIWDSPPKETRLCWIVRFTTVDTVKREDGFLPHPPDILVYIDAATGEIVGANFT